MTTHRPDYGNVKLEDVSPSLVGQRQASRPQQKRDR